MSKLVKMCRLLPRFCLCTAFYIWTAFRNRWTGPDFIMLISLLWTPAQRKRASMLYFANVIYLFIFYGRLILRPWLTEVRESFTRGGP